MPGINVCVCYDDQILDSRYDKDTYKRFVRISFNEITKSFTGANSFDRKYKITLEFSFQML